MAGTSKQTDSSCFPSSSSFKFWDVFLSFVGQDTRRSFIGNLYSALDQAGIRTFKDESVLERGEEIAIKAIHDSKMSIVVFSKNYSSSKWCVNELAEILECERTRGLIVLPVFYDVDPLNVRHLIGSYAEAFEKHKTLYAEELVETWRAALTTAANISGYDLKNDANGHEADLIQKIVNDVLMKLCPKYLNVTDHQVGIDSRVKEICQKLSIGSNDVRFIGIYGMSGIGKTTIVKALCNKIYKKFECSCFLENARDGFEDPRGLHYLLEQLIFQLLKIKDFKVTSVDTGISFVKERVGSKKVLIVLDDLDEIKQLKSLVGNWNWLGPGSRIIVTTSDLRLLVELQVDWWHEVKELDDDESLELFRWHAFRNTTPLKNNLMELSKYIVSYVGGLPLALEVLGSSLFERTMVEWESVYGKMKEIPHEHIQEKIRISYDALDDDKMRNIFLDIACFFIGMDKDDACGLYPEIGINILRERCLLTIDWGNKLRMHNLIRDMGREIGREESVKNPRMPSRLRFHEDAYDVLKKFKGHENIEGIRLVMPMKEEVDISTRAFHSLPNLRLLQISNVNLTGSFENIFEELRWFCWNYSSLDCLPSSFQAPKLIFLDMQHSKVKILWEGTKQLQSLKILNASDSRFLKTTPDFKGLENLEKLILQSCSSLSRIHPSIGLLHKLVRLDLRRCCSLNQLPEQLGNMGCLRTLDASYSSIMQLPDSIGHLGKLEELDLDSCENLRNLPSSICDLTSLVCLSLSFCSNLESLPKNFGNLTSLMYLHLSETNIMQLPDSIGHLGKLEKLDLECCLNLRNLPSSICYLTSLVYLSLSFCSNLESLPKNFGNLTSLTNLHLSETNIMQLPDYIGHLGKLEKLDLECCLNLRNLPSSICDLTSLVHLSLSFCSNLESLPKNLGNLTSLTYLNLSLTNIMQLPDSIGHLGKLEKLDLDFCKNLRNLPSSICDLTSLVHLSLYFCSNLESLPENLGNLTLLAYLDLSETNIMQLPDSIGHLCKLEKLDLFPKYLNVTEKMISEAAGETFHASPQESILATKSLAATGSVAEAEHKIVFLPGTETSPMHETSIEFIPAVTEGLFSVKQTEIIEVDPDPVEEARINIKNSVDPFMPMPKYELIVSSNENEECSSTDEVEVERDGPSPGDQTSPKPGINVNSSIYQNVQKILGCLRDGKTRRIGIYGNGGIGKTTLLKALFNHAEAQDMFDLIIWVTISTYSSTEKIQNQVAEQVFSHPAGSDTSMEAISHALRRKKVLFLLDDVSEKIDLDAVGITNPNQENGCGIILTTRSLDVCHLMAVDTQFEMDIISMEEAWKLFHDQVGEIIDSQDIEPYARAIVAACGGLPLTIVVTGRALREENNASMWQHALLEFLSLISSRKHSIKAEIQKLKFGYNKLKSRDVKDCFLYCALIQEDHGVNISELVKYLSYEDLVARSLADPYEKAYSIVNILLNASLLERTDDGVSVKMHAIIRELALVIMSPDEEGCQFLVRADIRLTLEPEDPNRSAVDVNVESELLNRFASEVHQFLLGASAGLTEPPGNEKWEQAKMIFLMDNDLSSLPDNLSCPKLLTLCFQRNNRLRVIPKSFFVGMPHLQILNLSGTRINSLPPSLFKLKLLKVLLLHDCKRFSMLSPEIGALEHLELLDLRETEIYNLPNAIASLTCLKHLLVSFYGTSNSSEFAKLPTELISKGIISRFLQLNELSIDVYPGDQRWSRGVETVAKEVLNLKELKNLSFYFPEVNLLELFIQESPSWKNKGLTKFKFIVGHNVKRIVARVTEDVEFVYNQQDRCLRFVNGETVPSSVEKVLSCSTAFYLDHHLKIQSLSEFGVSNINALEVCIVRECHEITTVTDNKGAQNSTLTTFPALEILVIHYLWNLRSIWAGPMPSGSLSRLKFLSVHTCPQLPFVLTSSMLQNLYSLEVLAVEDCQAVTDVILEESDVASGYVILPKLRKLRLHYLPKLVSIWKGTWPSVEHISLYNCPNLKSLPFGFELIESIKEIKAEKMWWDELIWEDTSLHLQLQAHFTEISYEDL